MLQSTSQQRQAPQTRGFLRKATAKTILDHDAGEIPASPTWMDSSVNGLPEFASGPNTPNKGPIQPLCAATATHQHHEDELVCLGKQALLPTKRVPWRKLRAHRYLQSGLKNPQQISSGAIPGLSKMTCDCLTPGEARSAKRALVSPHCAAGLGHFCVFRVPFGFANCGSHEQKHFDTRQMATTVARAEYQWKTGKNVSKSNCRTSSNQHKCPHLCRIPSEFAGVGLNHCRG